MKHAYLILAHNEWELLKILVSCLDDERNDIFVHIDSKVRELPQMSAAKAGLVFVGNRIDVRWGDLSVVEAEISLFEEALSRGPYAYYHLLSGVDLPIKSQNYIHAFCDANQGREFIGYTLTSITPEVVRKAQRWHLFPRSFKSGNIALKAARAGFLKFQEFFGIRRNRNVEFKKGSQWVSVTDGLARYFVGHQDWIRRTFSHTFCSDEMVFHTLCWHSEFRGNIYCSDDDAKGCMRAIGWRNGCLYDWEASDFEALKNSPALFARKFNSRDMDFINRIAELSR